MANTHKNRLEFNETEGSVSISYNEENAMSFYEENEEDSQFLNENNGFVMESPRERGI